MCTSHLRGGVPLPKTRDSQTPPWNTNGHRFKPRLLLLLQQQQHQGSLEARSGVGRVGGRIFVLVDPRTLGWHGPWASCRRTGSSGLAIPPTKYSRGDLVGQQGESSAERQLKLAVFSRTLAQVHGPRRVKTPAGASKLKITSAPRGPSGVVETCSPGSRMCHVRPCVHTSFGGGWSTAVRAA